jgi:hypothetical protein
VKSTKTHSSIRSRSRAGQGSPRRFRPRHRLRPLELLSRMWNEAAHRQQPGVADIKFVNEVDQSLPSGLNNFLYLENSFGKSVKVAPTQGRHTHIAYIRRPELFNCLNNPHCTMLRHQDGTEECVAYIGGGCQTLSKIPQGIAYDNQVLWRFQLFNLPRIHGLNQPF